MARIVVFSSIPSCNDFPPSYKNETSINILLITEKDLTDKVITLANHNRHKPHNEPIRIHGKNRCHGRQAREKACKRVAIGFALASDWLRKWREFSQPITGHSKTKTKQGPLSSSFENGVREKTGGMG